MNKNSSFCGMAGMTLGCRYMEIRPKRNAYGTGASASETNLPLYMDGDGKPFSEAWREESSSYIEYTEMVRSRCW